ncbi:MAG TPA: UDP-N-acetylmuramoyl-L-alanyl-D-glutamate--2,6-diaminopimelate ligase [Chloroflexi bacterium]|jgi:UDP-N-acetylmuramoyl-L-alanyl-D-glutamate--2,6-diaminopimelate ligase|nr:UDP-N-acetylmuramoyl-L-alanyl-D-glutamate--2,6-diaminopimelate ligase [Chloroflexota bacterium]
MLAPDTLLAALPDAAWRHWRPVNVANVVCDSREVRPGDLFVAVPGVHVDGHAFVPDALRAGAVACVVERSLPELDGVPTAIVANARAAFAHLQAALHGYPGRQLRVIGVTGTDGKTTTARLITGILRAAGLAVGTVDTVNAEIAGQAIETGFHTTTPDPPAIQAYLAKMVAAGMSYAVIESTSHGLAQHRVAACEYDVAVVTNITHEHLDYHGTYEAYREAKAMLFRALATAARKPGMPKVAVLNADDASYAALRPIPAEVQLSYGLSTGADVRATDITVSPDGLRFTVLAGGQDLAITSRLIGRYNVHNILAAVATARGLGIAAEAIRAGVAAVGGIPGRMEPIDRGQPFTTIVDFAHTPNALENALRTARELTPGRVIVVFGCAGLRDRSKRSVMGEVAGRLADFTVITAEDPRTEPLDAIMAAIADGCRQAGRVEGADFVCIGDRREAIAAALAMARPGDLVMAAGKGHERSMCYGTTEYPWSDHEAIVQGLERLGYTGATPSAPSP